MMHFTTSADAGGVLIGTDDFQYLCKNGMGDGGVDVFVLDNTKHVPKNAKYASMISGTGIRVYHYDCCSKSEFTEIPDGRYNLYYYEGTVYLVFVDNDLF